MIERVFVVGGGTMGRGIAQTVAAAGVGVTLGEVNAELARKALGGIEKSLLRAVEKGKITSEQAKETLSRITATDKLDEAGSAGLVIEAIVEDLAAKRDLFKSLDRLCPPAAILATNTSALSVSAIAVVCRHPERVVGLHFFNPAPVMKLVEVVRPKQTAEAVVADTKAFAEKIGKTPVEVRESPGFVVNRLLIPLINEAAWACREGVADPKGIDTAMELGAAHPMGPLALADMIGLDIVVDILKSLERDLGNPKYRPCPLLEEMLAQGRLGRKTGRGFFVYADKR